MVGKQQYAQNCPLAAALDVFGTRWSLLITRELVLGPRRFTDVLRQLETASTDMVTNRLRDLEQFGVAAKRDDRRWELTDLGYRFLPAVREMLIWSFQNDVQQRVAGNACGLARGQVNMPRRLLTLTAVMARTSAGGHPVSGSHALRIGDAWFDVTSDGERYVISETEAQNRAPDLSATPDGWISVVFGVSIEDLQAEGAVTATSSQARQVLEDLQLVGAPLRERVGS